MTVTIHLPPAMEEAFLAEAQAKGVSLDELVREVVLSARRPVSDAMGLSSYEWTRRFEAWVASHADITTVLPDSAMERESIYGDRGA